ncbi:uncharacterized protein AKAME5_000972100 [Lates japonicus]|uniref:Uncharacterized protein n=1 Tax=Lates japonicus TaxID=270547 RepID=A0AAD3MNP0_LATJO|nr:uncharacterized protein AKAME5_000972100 [Lates japonicus]
MLQIVTDHLRIICLQSHYHCGSLNHSHTSTNHKTKRDFRPITLHPGNTTSRLSSHACCVPSTVPARFFRNSAVNHLMAKEKSLKLGSNPPKRKKLGSDAGGAHAEESMGAEVKKKRKKMQVEEVPVQIQTNTADDKKQKKDKKRKQNQVTEQTQTKQTQVRTLTAEDVSL